MPLSDASHELKTLIQSRHPIVTIDTVEEERVDTLLQAVATDLKVPLFTWTVTHGLLRLDLSAEARIAKADGEHAIYGTTNPRVLVRHLATLTVRAIFHLKDLTTHLSDAMVARGLRDTAQVFLRSGSTAVLSGNSVHLPAELAGDAVPFALHLPNHEELRQVVHQLLRSLRRQRPFVFVGDGNASALPARECEVRQPVKFRVDNDQPVESPRQ